MFLNKDAYDQNPESSTIRQSSMIYYHRRPFGNYPLRVKLSSDTAANAGFVVAGMKLIKLLENDLK